jgi:peptidoglycan-N-acetylmuramic acid deacetylase
MQALGAFFLSIGLRVIIPVMKRPLALLLTFLVAVFITWGCDLGNLPPPATTPIAPTTAISPTEAASAHTPAPLAPPSPTVAAQLPPTEAPASEPVAAPDSTPELTTTPIAQPEPALSSPSAEAVTRVPTRPRPTHTPGGPLLTTPESQPTATAGTPEPPPSSGWREVVRVPPGNKRIALTFDAGASGETWPRIMATLRQHNVHITMFITGKFAEQYPDAIKQAVADGDEIANHTYSHLDSRKLTDEQLISELARTEAIIQNLGGVTTKPLWRPPFGARNNHVLNVAVAQGYRSIFWTLDSLDSVGQPKTPDFIFNRVTNTPGVNLDGAIVLQHFGSEASAEALPRELDHFQAIGLQVVTVSELLSP